MVSNGNGHGAWHARIPRAVLVAALTAALSLLSWAVVRWVSSVDAHIEGSVSGYSRLSVVETQVRETAKEVRAMRSDLLEQAKYLARRDGDFERVKELEGRLRELERRR